MILHDYRLPLAFSPSVVDLMVRLPPHYPAAPLDMFNVFPEVRRADGRALPCLSLFPFRDAQWQQWSRHRQPNDPWVPGVDGLATHMALVENAPRRGRGLRRVVMETRLALSGRHYDELKQHLFPGDGLEAVALLLCGRGRGPDRNQLVGRRVVPVPHDQVLSRRSDYVEWPVDRFLLPLVEEMERDDLGVVVVHCHPKGGRFFSKADDAGDQRLFPSVHSWFDVEGAHGAAVMLPGGEIIARFVGPNGEFEPVSVVSVAGDDIRLFRHLEKSERPPSRRGSSRPSAGGPTRSSRR